MNSQYTAVAARGRPKTEGRAGSRMLNSVVWTGAATWATQLITWAYMIVLARMLTPADFGLIGMANLLLEILTVASQFGVSAAIVMLRDLTQDQISQLNTVALMSSAALFAISCAAAYPLGHFFRAPALPVVIMVLSAGLLILSFRIVPDGLPDSGASLRATRRWRSVPNKAGSRGRRRWVGRV